MSLYRKKLSNGAPGKFWYYDFTYMGTRYNKSTGKTSEKEAKAVEVQAMEEVKERYQLTVTDGASEIRLQNAVDLAIEKPSKRTRSEDKNKHKRQIWRDFMAWLDDNFPKTKFIHQVSRRMAEGYINEIKKNGKFIKKIKHKGKSEYRAQKKLSASSINTYHKELEWVFKHLLVDAGLVLPMSESEFLDFS